MVESENHVFNVLLKSLIFISKICFDDFERELTLELLHHHGIFTLDPQYLLGRASEPPWSSRWQIGCKSSSEMNFLEPPPFSRPKFPGHHPPNFPLEFESSTFAYSIFRTNSQ